MARTHRFATETVDLPAQQGERVTIAVAAPSNLYREVGPFKFSPKAPNFYPGEPLCLTNHKDGRDSPLLRAPLKEGSSSLLNPSILFPLLAVLATGDAASGIIDPSLPQFLSTAAVASLAVGATLNAFVFPQLNQVSLSYFVKYHISLSDSCPSWDFKFLWRPPFGSFILFRALITSSYVCICFSFPFSCFWHLKQVDKELGVHCSILLVCLSWKNINICDRNSVFFSLTKDDSF